MQMTLPTAHKNHCNKVQTAKRRRRMEKTRSYVVSVKQPEDTP